MESLRERLKYLTVKEIVAICQVDPATARRWKRQATCPPKTAQLLLTGDLGVIDAAWEGWILRNGKIISPEGWWATPGDIRAMQLKEAQVRAMRVEMLGLREELAELNRTAPWLDDQPAPDSWDLQKLLG